MPNPVATYYDGRTSARATVELSLHPDGLALFGADGRLIERWPYADIRRIEGAQGPGLAVTRLQPPGSSIEPRLEIASPAFAADLSARAPLTLTAGATGRRERRAVVAWALGAIAATFVVVVYALPAIAARLAPLVPPGVEARIGEALEPQVRQMFGRDDALRDCTAREGIEILDRLVARLAGAADLHLPLKVSVVDSPVVNAFALPGGRIFIFSGLLARARGPDELVGVLAHEIGHVKYRHGLRAVIQAGGLGLVLGTIFGDFAGGTAITLGSRALIQSAFSREAEREADAFAIDLMLKAGGDPLGLARFFESLDGADPGALAWIASHPANAERIAAIRAAVGPATRRAAALSEGEWTRLGTICQKPS